MGELGRLHQLIIPFFGHNITINLEVIVMTWIVFSILIVLGLFARKRKILPRPIQALGELIVSLLYDLTEDALGKELAKTYAPHLCALSVSAAFQLAGHHSASGRTDQRSEYDPRTGPDGLFYRPLRRHKIQGV